MNTIWPKVCGDPTYYRPPIRVVLKTCAKVCVYQMAGSTGAVERRTTTWCISFVCLCKIVDSGIHIPDFNIIVRNNHMEPQVLCKIQSKMWV